MMVCVFVVLVRDSSFSRRAPTNMTCRSFSLDMYLVTYTMHRYIYIVCVQKKQQQQKTILVHKQNKTIPFY